MTLNSLLWIAGTLLIGSAHAGGVGAFLDDYRTTFAEGKASHIVDIDNDTLLLTGNDGLYTNGFRYVHKLTIYLADEARSAGWRIGQEMYTASNIKLPPLRVGPPDRPYAGWLYGGVFHEVHRADGTHTRFGIDIGCLGPCAGGEWSQTQLHRVLNQPLPQGWSRQVRNEPGIVLYADIAPIRWRPSTRIDVTPSIRGRFGNIFTDLGGGVTVRAGRLDVLPGRSAFYGFLRADVHAVGYNATLQGGYFSSDNPHTVEPRRLVGEAEIGVAWADGPYAIRAGVVRRSNEIRSLPSRIGSQNYARLQFVYAP